MNLDQTKSFPWEQIGTIRRTSVEKEEEILLDEGTGNGTMLVKKGKTGVIYVKENETVIATFSVEADGRLKWRNMLCNEGTKIKSTCK